MAQLDYYELLGVPRTATTEEIKAAYRRLARQYHPDINRDDPEAEERFKLINEAYEILADPEKRAQYDRFGSTRLFSEPGFDPFGSVHELFEMFFGTRPEATGVRGLIQGDDLHLEVEIELEEVLKGATQQVTIKRLEVCPACRGSGAEPGTHTEFCPDCRGTGRVRYVQTTLLGSISRIIPCSRCEGEGELIEVPCKRCEGRRRVQVSRPVTVSIPPGVEEGTVMTYPGQGDAGLRGGADGDLHVTVRIKPHPRLARRGTELITRLNLTFPQLALGDEVEIETLDGRRNLVIPAGTQPGEELSLKGLGLPPAGGGPRGDLHVLIGIKIPKQLNDAQRELLRQFAEASGIHLKGDTRKKSFFEQLRSTLKEERW